MKKLFLLTIALLLSACGAKLDGTYIQGNAHFTFKSNGKASTNMLLGFEYEVPYEVDGDKITIHFQNGTPIWTLKKDGSIDAGPFGTFTKK